MSECGLLLLNLGTPDSADTSAVRRYLREFLSDPRVLDLPRLSRAILLNGLILPFRPRKSAEAYRAIWTARGSPLLFHAEDLREKVQSHLGSGFRVEIAMRYQNPSINAALKRFAQNGVDRIVVFPLFPQYSSAAWGSAAERVFREASRAWNIPFLAFVPPFFDHPSFVKAFSESAASVLSKTDPDMVLMSFHGLPERHVIKSDESGGTHCLRSAGCCDAICLANRNCYRAHCFATARAIAAELGLRDDEFEVAFQSRLGRSPWIQPYTDVRVVELARSGAKRIVVISPSFVADCLETLEEIGIRARDDFRAAGGEELTLVPSLNSSESWARAVTEIAVPSIALARGASLETTQA